MSTETTLVAPFAGTVVSVPHAPRQTIRAGTVVAVIEAMKMEHEVIAEHDATVADVRVAVGETVAEGQPLLVLTAVGDPALATGAREARADEGSRDDPKAVRDVQGVRDDPQAVRDVQGVRDDLGQSATATPSGSMRLAPTPSASATTWAGAPRARISLTCSILTASSSTGR